MDRLVNLTPHRINLYPPDTPDTIVPGTVRPRLVLEPSPDFPPARLGEQPLGTEPIEVGVPVTLVAYGASSGGTVRDLPPPCRGRWYVVALAVGLAAHERDDLLVLHEAVRDTSNRMIGARGLARPHRR